MLNQILLSSIFYVTQVSIPAHKGVGIKGTVMQVEKALIDDRLRVSKVS